MSITCPKCGHEIDSNREQDEVKGRAFAIVLWSHMGIEQNAMAKAFGVTATTIHNQLHKLEEKWGPKCDFYYFRKLRDGRRKLSWFYRGGRRFHVMGGKGYDYDDNGKRVNYFTPYYAITNCKKHRIDDLSDWERDGFVFEA